jgi:DNA-directed RNA polymerase subunit K/omega
MIYPTINELTKGGEYNRYEIALATAKCARMITNEYTRQRVEAERQMTGNKETDKPLTAMIDKEVRDTKAVKLAIGRMHKGEYTIVHKDPAEQEREEQAILAGINRPYEETRDEEEDLADEDLMDDELSDELSDEDLGDELDEDSDEELSEELEETEAPFESDEN